MTAHMKDCIIWNHLYSLLLSVKKPHDWKVIDLEFEGDWEFGSGSAKLKLADGSEAWKPFTTEGGALTLHFN